MKASAFKWNKEHVKSLSCNVPIEMADSFRQWCADRGTTVNSTLRRFVEDCLGIQPEEDEPATSEAVHTEKPKDTTTKNSTS